MFIRKKKHFEILRNRQLEHGRKVNELLTQRQIFEEQHAQQIAYLRGQLLSADNEIAKLKGDLMAAHHEAGRPGAKSRLRKTGDQ